MPKFPTMPGPGSSVLDIYRTVSEIIAYLPSLKIVGDNKSTSVTSSPKGQIIHSMGKGTSGAGAAAGGGGGGGQTYDGPFKCEYDQTNNRIYVYDGIVVAGNYAYGSSYNGTSKYPIALTTLASGTAYVVIHMYVTYGSVWNRSFEVYNSQNYYTTQTNVGVGYDYRHFWYTLASFTYDADTPTVTNLVQWHMSGDVHIMGRAT